MYYHEDKDGQILEEGINEAGRDVVLDRGRARPTRTHGVHMIPFYIYYSMFGFQRIGDLTGPPPTSRARGFLLGGTAGPHHAERRGPAAPGRPQPPDGVHRPDCVSYDPTFAYELAVIIQDGLNRMYERAGGHLLLPHGDQREVPACRRCPRARDEGILEGHVQVQRRAAEARAARAAAGQRHHPARGDRAPRAAGERVGRHADVWSCPASTSCAARHASSRAGTCCTRRKARRSPGRRARGDAKGPVVAATDYMKRRRTDPRAACRRRYKVLGTDGFGRSDYAQEPAPVLRGRTASTSTVAALKALADDGEVPAAKVAEAIKKYGLDTERPAPWTV